MITSIEQAIKPELDQDIDRDLDDPNERSKSRCFVGVVLGSSLKLNYENSEDMDPTSKLRSI